MSFPVEILKGKTFKMSDDTITRFNAIAEAQARLALKSAGQAPTLVDQAPTLNNAMAAVGTLSEAKTSDQSPEAAVQ